MGFRSFCFEQFFLHRSVANLMILTIIDVCLIVFCLKSFICITHCVTLIPSCYIALSHLFAKAYIAIKFLMSLLKPPLPIEKSCVRHCRQLTPTLVLAVSWLAVSLLTVSLRQLVDLIRLYAMTKLSREIKVKPIVH